MPAKSPQTNTPHNLLHSIRLTRSENVGAVTYSHLIKRFGSAEKAIEMIPQLAAQGGRKNIQICSVEEAEQEITKVRDFGGDLLVLEDERYPAFLKHIPSPPPLLHVKGNIKLLQQPAIGIVGSRHCSLNGQKMAYDMGLSLAQAGYVIVSGLARGIDACAHQGSLEHGTIAVLGGGVNVVYPQENKDLYKAISSQGLLVSEYRFSEEPLARNFPRRNRIIAGLSKGILVVEARAQSGSMITAGYANDYGRDIFAVPGSPLDARCAGTNKLIQDGAMLVQSVDDILDHLESSYQLKEIDLKDYYKVPGVEVQHISKNRNQVIDLLSSTPTNVDDIIRHTGMPPMLVWDIILELELAGKLERLPGNQVYLKQ